MPIVAIFGIVLFAFGLLLGYLSYKSRIWNWVDVVYYPLAATGVALLFLSNATQRSLLEVDNQLDQNRNTLKELQASRPTVDGVPPKSLVDTSFKLIAGIVELADVCSKVPRIDPTCAVAEKMRSAAAEFVAISGSDYGTPELQLVAACAAGDRLISKLRTSDHMSSLVGDELAAQYQEARSRPHHFLDYSATEREAEQFERKARKRVSEVRQMIADTSPTMTYVFAINEAEVKAGSTVMHALYPCLAVPQSTLEPLANWTVKRQSNETERAHLQDIKKQVQSTPTMSKNLQWMQLNLWPFVLIAGLAFKFAKGVSAVRKSLCDARAAAGGNKCASPSAADIDRKIDQVSQHRNASDSEANDA